MSCDRITQLLQNWDEWAVSADRSEDGWESDYPQWRELITCAENLLLEPALSRHALQCLEKCWLLAEEDEVLVRLSEDRVSECWAALAALSESEFPAVRWQVYSALAGGGASAERVLRNGISDPDPYARRRAILALASLRPKDSLDLALQFYTDSDPYIRQASLAFLGDLAGNLRARQIVEQLSGDLIQHVREAAEKLSRKVEQS